MKLIALIILLLVSPTLASASENRTWFVQVWTTDTEVELTDGDPGRIEVEAEGRFVACVQAKAVKNWNTVMIAPIAMGFMFKGDKSTLKFKTYGALSTNMHVETKISEVRN
jgi:hypothetical protein